MKSKEGKYFKIDKIGFYIVGKIFKECKVVYKYELIKSNYPHNPKVKYHWIWKGDSEFGWHQMFKFYDTLDELIVDSL